VKAELSMLMETLEERAARDAGQRVPKLKAEFDELTAKESGLTQKNRRDRVGIQGA
jgi:hypothetical protein